MHENKSGRDFRPESGAAGLAAVLRHGGAHLDTLFDFEPDKDFYLVFNAAYDSAGDYEMTVSAGGD